MKSKFVYVGWLKLMLTPLSWYGVLSNTLNYMHAELGGFFLFFFPPFCFFYWRTCLLSWLNKCPMMCWYEKDARDRVLLLLWRHIAKTSFNRTAVYTTAWVHRLACLITWEAVPCFFFFPLKLWITGSADEWSQAVHSDWGLKWFYVMIFNWKVNVTLFLLVSEDTGII